MEQTIQKNANGFAVLAIHDAEFFVDPSINRKKRIHIWAVPLVMAHVKVESPKSKVFEVQRNGINFLPFEK